MHSVCTFPGGLTQPTEVIWHHTIAHPFGRLYLGQTFHLANEFVVFRFLATQTYARCACFKWRAITTTTILPMEICGPVDLEAFCFLAHNFIPGIPWGKSRGASSTFCLWRFDFGDISRVLFSKVCKVSRSMVSTIKHIAPPQRLQRTRFSPSICKCCGHQKWWQIPGAARSNDACGDKVEETLLVSRWGETWAEFVVALEPIERQPNYRWLEQQSVWRRHSICMCACSTCVSRVLEIRFTRTTTRWHRQPSLSLPS